MTVSLPQGPVLVASHNKGKLREFSAAFAPLGRQVVSAAEHDLPAPDETGSTFEANAEIKAVAAMQATGLAALSDDSGLAIAALDGAPGVGSAPFAEAAGGYAGAFAKLENMLRDQESPAKAAFVCVLCLAVPGEAPLFVRGEVDGTLIFPPRGEGGFGYDPIFVPDGETRSFGEMMPEEKAHYSHRARAISALMVALDQNA